MALELACIGRGVGEGAHIDGRATGYGDKGGGIGQDSAYGGYVDVEEAYRTVTTDWKGKWKANCTPIMQVGQGEAKVDVGKEDENPVKSVQRRNWAWTEKAMYRDIGLGFYFGLPREVED